MKKIVRTIEITFERTEFLSLRKRTVTLPASENAWAVRPKTVETICRELKSEYLHNGGDTNDDSEK